MKWNNEYYGLVCTKLHGYQDEVENYYILIAIKKKLNSLMIMNDFFVENKNQGKFCYD